MPFNSNAELAQHLIASGVLKSRNLKTAFQVIDRSHFVPSALVSQAYEDHPLPIGLGQTISQPTTVAFMLELLRPEPGNRVLEVGAGSGYVVALLAQAVGKRGQVVALERLPELVALAKSNLAPYKFSNLELIHADGSLGWPDIESFDRIIVSAAALALPTELTAQLSLGGRLVAPVGDYPQDVVLVEKAADGLHMCHYPGFVFVPLIPGKRGQSEVK